MSAGQARLDLRIDVFEEKSQWARALPSLTPPQLIEAILQEFRELEHLSSSPDDYRLLRADDKAALDDEKSLQEQVADNTRLILAEAQSKDLPGADALSHPVYFRDQTMGQVYKFSWQPAIIGRPDPNQPGNELLAVNLESHKKGLRVSRRHAQITEQNGQYFIRSLSRNPTAVKNTAGNSYEVGAEKQPLQNGDIIYLERSNIALKFIVREEAADE